MPHKCCILHCQSRDCLSKKPKNGSFHHLPKDPVAKKIWLDAIGEENLCGDAKNIYICSLHFDDSQINKTLNVIRLKDDAIPTLFLRPNTSESECQNQEGNKGKSKGVRCKMVCAVVQCPNSQQHSRGSGVTFYSLPKDIDIRTAWMKALKLKEWKSDKICSEHFPESSFYETKYGRRLYPNALPLITLDPGVPASLMICRICLVHHRDMYNIKEFSQAFEQITSISASQGESGRLPQCLCWECAARLTAAASFKAKALLSDGLLRDLLKPDKLMRIRDVKTINRKHYGLNTSLIQRHFDSDHFDYHINDTFAGPENNTDLCENDNFQTENDDFQVETNDFQIEINEEQSHNETDYFELDATSDAVVQNQTTDSPEAVELDNIQTGKVTRLSRKKNPNDEQIKRVTRKNVKNNPNDNKNKELPYFIILNGNNKVKETEKVPPIILENKLSDNPIKRVTRINLKNKDNKIKVTHTVGKKKPITQKDTRKNVKNNSNANITLHTDHNYSNLNNTGDNNNENSKENIANNIQKNTDENNSSDNADTNETDASPREVEMDDVDNKNLSNWNIGVEKRSKTLAIVPVSMTDVNQEKKKRPTALKRKLEEIPILKKKLEEGTTLSAVRNYVRPKFDIRSKEIDSDVFEVSHLTYEEQVLEIQLRQESPAYIYAPLKCTVCYTGFKNEAVYDRHMQKHSDKYGPIECVICKVHKRDKNHMSKHMSAQHSKEYKCKKCPFVTRFRQIAMSHIEYHAGNRYECEKCHAVFAQSSSLFGHRRLYHMPDVPCELCGYTFISQHGLRNHKARQHRMDHDKELNGPHCKKCDVKFYCDEAYYRHLGCSAKHLKDEKDPRRIRNEPQIVPLVKVRRFVKGSNNPYTPLRRREKGSDNSNAAKEPYVCEQCGKELKNHMLYSVHFMRAHPNETPNQIRHETMSWMCDYCAKFFRSKQGLDMHMLVHTGDMYECDYCGHKFCQKQSLVGHIQVKHMNQPPSNKCELCDKLFTLPRNLKKHLAIHMGEKPHECEICLKRFTAADGLHSHVRHVHFKIPWPKKRRTAKEEVDEE